MLKGEYEILDQMDIKIQKEKFTYQKQGFLIGSSLFGGLGLIIIIIILF
jgi:hypothetical protein